MDSTKRQLLRSAEKGATMCEYALMLSLLSLMLLLAINQLTWGPRQAFADVTTAIGGGTNQIDF